MPGNPFIIYLSYLETAHVPRFPGLFQRANWNQRKPFKFSYVLIGKRCLFVFSLVGPRFFGWDLRCESWDSLFSPICPIYIHTYKHSWRLNLGYLAKVGLTHILRVWVGNSVKKSWRIMFQSFQNLWIFPAMDSNQHCQCWFETAERLSTLIQINCWEGQ